jgi:hypothetical protein
VSALSDIISQINSITDFKIPIPSGSVVTASVSNASGSVNSIIGLVNSLSGFLIPTEDTPETTSSYTAGTGSVNNLINYINQVSGYTLPQTSGSLELLFMATGSGSINSIISTINSLTGYNLPSASGYIISASSELSSGSVNDIINYLNNLTGYSIPGTSVTFTSGSNVSGAPILYQVPTPVSGTIPTTGIRPGAIIEAEHLLRIINALNGVNPNLIILSGSLQVTGSANFSSSLVLPFVPNENFIESVSGSMEGTDTIDGGSF